MRRISYWPLSAWTGCWGSDDKFHCREFWGLWNVSPQLAFSYYQEVVWLSWQPSGSLCRWYIAGCDSYSKFCLASGISKCIVLLLWCLAIVVWLQLHSHMHRAISNVRDCWMWSPWVEEGYSDLTSQILKCATPPLRCYGNCQCLR